MLFFAALMPLPLSFAIFFSHAMFSLCRVLRHATPLFRLRYAAMPFRQRALFLMVRYDAFRYSDDASALFALL